MKQRSSTEAHRLERELRSQLTVNEYARLVRQLSGAVEAIAMLRDKAPGVLDRMLASSDLVRTDHITEDAQSALAELVNELRAAAAEREQFSRRASLRVLPPRETTQPSW